MTLMISKETYSWGTLLKISKGISWTVVIHPDEQQRLRALALGEMAFICTEDGTRWQIFRTPDGGLKFKPDSVFSYHNFTLAPHQVADADL